MHLCIDFHVILAFSVSEQDGKGYSQHSAASQSVGTKYCSGLVCLGSKRSVDISRKQWMNRKLFTILSLLRSRISRCSNNVYKHQCW